MITQKSMVQVDRGAGGHRSRSATKRLDRDTGGLGSDICGERLQVR